MENYKMFLKKYKNICLPNIPENSCKTYRKETKINGFMERFRVMLLNLSKNDGS